MYVPTFFSHLSKILIDWYSASTRPASLQESTCSHVSTHLSQLRHVVSWCGLYRDWIRFVPAIFITCFHSHSWNKRDTSCNVSFTSLQENSLNPSGFRTPSLKIVLLLTVNGPRIVGYHLYWMSYFHSPQILQLVWAEISLGQASAVLQYPKWFFFAWSSIIQFNWDGRDKYWYSILSSWCDFTCE